MKLTIWLTLLSTAVLAGCAQPTPEQQIVDSAAAALGGRDRILAVKTIVIEGEGTNWNLGQDMTPDASSQTFTLSPYRRSVDVAAGRARIEQTRTPNFAYFQGPQPQKQVLGIDSEVGYNIGASGNATRVSDAAAKDRRADVYHHPLTIVRAALNPGVRLANPRTDGSARVLDITTADGLAFTLAIDGTSSLPTRVAYKTANPNLGDIVVETSFAEYQDVSGLKLPAHLTTKIDQHTTAEIRATKQTVDTDVGDLSAPAAAAAAAPIAGPPPANVTAEEVAKGVWLLAGQSHHSVLVEFGDHLMLIEAPQSEVRTIGVIAKARELRPDKPLTQVVNSHHHFDHSAGIRAAVSEGLGVVTHAGNRAFFEEIVKRPHTVAADALAKKPAPLSIQTVDDELVVEDKMMAVILYPVTGNPHSDTMLMAYFPRERLLVEVDAYSPGAAIQPYAPNLLENITKRKLRVDRIVPLHGTIAPFSELVKAAAATSN